MEDDRFDALSRVFAGELTRRTLGAFAAGILAMLAPSPAASDFAEAARKKKKVKKPKTTCRPQCDGKQCGPDRCGGQCRPGCSSNRRCNDQGRCVCTPNCTDRRCGDDGCGNANACGTCGSGQQCSTQGQCVCAPSCAGKQCGGDGCDGQCGPGCLPDETCIGGQCCPTYRACLDNTLCCSGEETCLNDTVCCPTKRRCGDVCCPAGQACSGNGCCPIALACPDLCCATHLFCISGQCRDAKDCDVNQNQCPEGFTCTQDDGCCPNDKDCGFGCCTSGTCQAHVCLPGSG